MVMFRSPPLPPLSIGQRVRIAPWSQFYGEDSEGNPKDTTGEVTAIRQLFFPYESALYAVQWPNGWIHYYTRNDLQAIARLVLDAEIGGIYD